MFLLSDVHRERMECARSACMLAIAIAEYACARYYELRPAYTTN